MAGTKACCMDWPLCDHVVASDYDPGAPLIEPPPALCPRCGTTTVADWVQPLGEEGSVEPVARCPACDWTN